MDVSSTVVRYSNVRRSPQSSNSGSQESLPSVKYCTSELSVMKPPAGERTLPDDENCAIVFSTTKIRLNDVLVGEQRTAVPCVTVRTTFPKDAESSASGIASTDSSTSEVSSTVTAVDSEMKIRDGDNESQTSSLGGDNGSKQRCKLSSASTISSNHSSLSSFSAKTTETGSNDENYNSTCTGGIVPQNESSKIVTAIKKARNKGRKLLSSSKNRKPTTELIDEASQAIFQDDESLRQCSDDDSERLAATESALVKWLRGSTRSKGEFGIAANMHNSQQTIFHPLIERFCNLPFFKHRITIFVVLLGLTLISPGFILGLLWGLYIAFVGFLFFFVSEPVPVRRHPPEVPVEVIPDFAEAKENKELRTTVYKGWMNELRGRYDSATYHVNNTQTVLVRLDGHILRVSRPERVVLKHTFHVDPTLTEPEPTMVGQSIYDLTGAKVSLRPKRLAARRWWSRKYPIYIRFPSSKSEISTIDSVMQRSQSFHQPDRLMNPSLSTSDFNGSARKMTTVKEDADECDIAGHEGDTEESSESEAETRAQLVKSDRSNSTGDLSSFAETTEFQRQGMTKRRGTSLYLFVRSAREKERWFHRFREACSQYHRPSNSSGLFGNLCSSNVMGERDGLSFETGSIFARVFERSSSTPSISRLIDFSPHYIEYLKYISNQVQFRKSMAEVMSDLLPDKKEELGGVVHMDLGRVNWEPGVPAGRELVLAANAIAARIFFDFCRDSYWCGQVKSKIQSKLATIHLPYFIERLELSSLDLGNITPEIVAVYAPILDEWGLWIDFELRYHGKIHLVLETRVNLMKLRDGFQRSDAKKKASKLTSSIRAHHYSDEDLPESPESSPDEDFGCKTEKVSTTRERTGKKILSIVDKIASSKYFQGASQLKPVKKMMEGISSTRLMLNVYVTCVEGTMTVNLPPPPSDRLWYAFRRPPTLSIRAVPQVGDRSVDLTTISDWIENRLRLLLEKFLVCPNLDDIIIPVMSGNNLLKCGYNK